MKINLKPIVGKWTVSLFKAARDPSRQLICLLGVVTAFAAVNARANTKIPPAPKPVRFAHITDPHVLDARLGCSGAAFQAYLAADPKMLRESEAIFDAAIENILKQDIRFVIISGDLTKDGELRDHILVAKYLAKLERHGIQVFVVPGNHDIYNGHAVRYVGDTNRPVAGTSPREFVAIYHRFGYGQAVDRDTNSLSYVAEPVPGFLLLAIDSCKYDESKLLGEPVTSGRIRPETMAWIQGVMQKAHADGKQVVAFMHHGLNQHFFGENELFTDYLVDDWASTSMQLAQTGLKVIFTGHYHSQDASYLVDENLVPQSDLCDVETAALAVYPCAYRIATLDSANMLHIESELVTNINFDTGGMAFQDYALNAVWAPTVAIAQGRIETTFGLAPADAALVAPLVAQGVIANYAGDESPSAETQAIIGGLISQPEPRHTLGVILLGLWTDLPPYADNELVLPIE
jgi:hypothetical protein